MASRGASLYIDRRGSGEEIVSKPSRTRSSWMFLTLALAMALPATGAAEEAGIRIVSPRPGTVVRPGVEVTVVVEGTGGFEPASVLIFLGGRTQLLKSPPFEATLPIDVNQVEAVPILVSARGASLEPMFQAELTLELARPDGSSVAPNVVPLVATQGLTTFGFFHYTLSPDDRWLVYFEREPRQGGYDVELRVLDLITQTEHALPAPPGGHEPYWDDDCWSHDGRVCVMPPVPRAGPRRAPQMYIEIVEGRPRLVDQTRVSPFELSTGTPADQALGYRQIDRAGFTCSDCIDRQTEERLLRTHVDAQFLEFQNRRPVGSAVSRDGTRIFYQKGYRTRRSTLFVLDPRSGRERELISFPGAAGDCVAVSEITPSPDLRRLAFLLTNSCGAGRAALYLLDLEDGSSTPIADIIYGPMHWNSTSERLYFHRCQKVGGCGASDGLCYIEVKG
jgi:hypothetical protein